MRNKSISRLLAALLSVVMMMALTIPAFAAETDDTGPDLETIAAMFVDWDGSYELPNLDEFSPEDQETVKAMVDAIMVSREAETQVQDEIPLTVSFSDVPPSHQFYKGIIYCASKGIVNGYPDGTFRPTTTVAKNHFSAMLARAFYASDVAKYDTESYKKVYGTFGATNYTLAVNGILNNTSFRWDYTKSAVMTTGINRYDMAMMMTNIMAKKGFSASTSQKNAIQAKITDYKNIPSQYRDAVKNVYALGIITGYGDGSFKGTNIMNRGQAAIVIQRMAQYAPVQGDGNNDQYDDGTEQKPNTGNNNNTGNSNTGSNTGSSSGSSTGSSGNTGSSNTGTTQTDTTGKLTNGKPITEANVLAMIQELLKKYPEGSTWSASTYRTDFASNTMNQIAQNYTRANAGSSTTSMQAGCGGLTSLFSDSIFGSGNANPARKVPNNTARPGDVIITLNKDGKLLHVSLATTGITGYDIYSTNSFPAVTELNGGGTNGKIYLSTHKGLPTKSDWAKLGQYDYGYYEVWTRYPTNGTPWTGSTSSGNSSGNTGSNSGTTGSGSSSSGNSSSNTSVNWVTTSNPCGVCGKTGGRQVRSSDGGRYVCENCWNDPSGIGKWYIE